jgi:hypothetical protein
VDQVVQKIDLIEIYFYDKHKLEDSDDDDLENDIESFMQNVANIIDNHSDLQVTMLQILAKLSCINYLGFGFRCFQTLIEQMKSSLEIEV